MRLSISRLATGVAAILFALATISVSTAHAEEYFDDFGDGYEDPISTMCGSGTKEHCGQKAIMTCDWIFHLAFNPVTKQFEFKLGKSNCRQTGTEGLYKDIADLDPRILCTLSDPLTGTTGKCPD